jgi:opacity protein-like surface antigen
MKKIVAGIVTSLSFAAALGAADTPRTEAFLGYNFVRFNSASGLTPSFDASGGSAQFAWNFSHWFGLAIDGGAVNKGGRNGAIFDTTVAHLVAGPRVVYHNHSRFTPFGDVMFGGSYGTTSRQITVLPQAAPHINDGLGLDPNVPISVRLQASNTGFSMMTGGGVDIKLSRTIAFRPFAADYYLVRKPRLGTFDDVNKNNWRFSAGFNFMFGGAK